MTVADPSTQNRYPTRVGGHSALIERTASHPFALIGSIAFGNPACVQLHAFSIQFHGVAPVPAGYIE